MKVRLLESMCISCVIKGGGQAAPPKPETQVWVVHVSIGFGEAARVSGRVSGRERGEGNRRENVAAGGVEGHARDGKAPHLVGAITHVNLYFTKLGRSKQSVGCWRAEVVVASEKGGSRKEDGKGAGTLRVEEGRKRAEGRKILEEGGRGRGSEGREERGRTRGA